MIFGRNNKNRPDALQKAQRKKIRPDALEKDRRPDALKKARPRPDAQENKLLPSKGRIIRYMMMPEILPRIQELTSRFGHFAFLLALIYGAVRLLPQNHPYLNGRNVGRFGIRDVIGAAANNLVLKRENADQIAVFSAIVMSIILVVAQFAMIMYVALMPQAQAASFFETPNPDRDVVFIYLTQVFGPSLNIFAPGANVIGTPIHAGLYAMLSFYSQAMMVLAVFIVVYYIITVVGEAAISGTPFGRRFNSLWAPIRLIVALGLLVPLGSGLNSAQYITLYVAKLASGMATQAWTRFAGPVSGTNPTNVFIRVDAPSVMQLFHGIYMNEVCASSLDQMQGPGTFRVDEILGEGSNANVVPVQRNGGTFRSGTQMLQAARTGYTQTSGALWWASQSQVPFTKITYAWSSGRNSWGYALCGRINYNIENSDYSTANERNIRIAEIETIQAAYIDEIGLLQRAIKPIADQIALHYVNVNNPNPPASRPDISGVGAQLQQIYEQSQQRLSQKLTAATDGTGGGAAARVFEDMVSRGWGGAGLWYMRIGQVNQQLSSAARNIPEVQPLLQADDGTPGQMQIAEESRMNASGVRMSYIEELRGALISGEQTFADGVRRNLALFSPRYAEDASGLPEGEKFSMTWFIKWVFGARTLFAYANGEAANLDPMVGLMMVGDELINRAMTFLGIVVATSVGSGILAFFSSGAATAINTIFTILTPFLFMFTTFGFGIGMLLYYLLPLMPFIYFFFAVVTWVGEIFEAVVAMPLWALAHLKIDGDGLPGPLATNGYFLLLGIFVRPILIIFGMIGAMLTFGAGAFMLNSTFDVVVGNIQRGQELGPISTFVYVVLFGWLCYQLGTVSFKMIDMVPNQILRWIGQGGATPYSDGKGDVLGDGSRMLLASAMMVNPALESVKGLRQGSMRAGRALRGKVDAMRGGAGGKPDAEVS